MRGFRNKLKSVWQKLIQQDATPTAIALGFAIGLFATFYPVPILDTLIALLIARIVRANTVACLIGNNFILLIYPIIPFLLAAEVFVGRQIVRAPPFQLPSHHEITISWLLHQSGPNLKALIIGGLVLGIPSAILFFFIVRKAAKKWQERKSTGI